MNKEEKELHYYYAAITYKRKSDPGPCICSFAGESSNGHFPVTGCIKYLERTLEDLEPGSIVISNVIEVTEEDYTAYLEHYESLKTKED